MRKLIFRVKKPSCKILKTKNCVPFEVSWPLIHVDYSYDTAHVRTVVSCVVDIYLIQTWGELLWKVMN